MVRAQIVDEELGALMAQRPRVLFADGRVKRGDDVRQRDTAVRIEAALGGGRHDRGCLPCGALHNAAGAAARVRHLIRARTAHTAAR